MLRFNERQDITVTRHFRLRVSGLVGVDALAALLGIEPTTASRVEIGVSDVTAGCQAYELVEILERSANWYDAGDSVTAAIQALINGLTESVRRRPGSEAARSGGNTAERPPFEIHPGRGGGGQEPSYTPRQRIKRALYRLELSKRQTLSGVGPGSEERAQRDLRDVVDWTIEEVQAALGESYLSPENDPPLGE